MKNFKKVLAIVLSIAMILGMNTISFADGEATELPDLVLDGGELAEGETGSPMIGTYTPPTSRGQATDGYKYMGWASLLESVPDTTIADGNYRYLVMTYTGDITQFRVEFTRMGTEAEGASDEKEGPYWFNPEGQTYYFVTADETPIPLVGDNTTIVIDLAKSANPNSLDGSGYGVGLDWYNDGLHMHCDEMVIHGNGEGFTISNAYLTTTLPVIEEETTEAPTEEATEAPTEEATEAPTEEATEAPTEAPLPDEIVLDDGDGGAFVGHAVTGEADGYSYAGYVYLKGATADYKYLQLTYTGSLANFRFEIEGDQTYWFDTWQALKFVDVDGNDFDTSYSDEARTIVIDLEKSGAELGWGNGLHIHTENLLTNGGVNFIDGRLLKTAPEVEAPTEAPTEEATEAPTEAPTEEATEAPTEEPTEAPTEAPLPDEIVLDDGDGGAFVGHEVTGEADGYSFVGYVYLKGATAEYKYLQLTYTGSLANFRFEIQGDNTYWFDTWQAVKFVDVDGNDFDTSYSDTARTIVIDLEKSGAELGWGDGLYIHTENLLTNGGVNFIDGRLLKTAPEVEAPTEEATEAPTEAPTEEVTEPSTDAPVVLPDEIVLDGDDTGASALIGSYNSGTDGYAYLGYVYLKEATADYKYLQMTYTGCLTGIRLENDGMVYWFNEEGQTSYFVTADGNDIPLVGDNTTIVIDLEASGLELGWDGGMHIHSEGMATNGALEITDARLLKTYTAPEAPVVPGTITVEAEDFTAQEGVSVKDVEDATLVYSIHENDSMTYTINIEEAGYYAFNVVAGRAYDKTSEIALRNVDDFVIAKATISTTGGWNVCENFEGTVVYLYEGEQTFSLYAVGGSYNVDSFSLVPVESPVGNGTIRVEAEAYDSASGIEVTKRPENDTAIVNYVHTGDYMVYTVEVPVGGKYGFNVSASKAYGMPSVVALTDGTDTLAEAQIEVTGSWYDYQEFNGSTVNLAAGTYTFYIRNIGGNNNIDYFDLYQVQE